MSGLVYIVLLIYPAITLLPTDPRYLKWWWRTGGSVPPEIEAEQERRRGNILIIKFILLIIACLWLSRVGQISLRLLGLTWEQPRMFNVVGVPAILFSLFLMGLIHRLRLKSSLPVDAMQPFLIRESASKLILIMVVGAFAEELWRALALAASSKANVSELVAVFMTSLVFGIGHVFSYRSLGRALGRLLPPAIGGAFLGSLFLLSRTLFVPMACHLLINSFGALMGRKRLMIQTGMQSSL